MFFASSNAVTSFFKYNSSKENVSYAAIGKLTAKTLKNFVSEVHFIGKGDVNNAVIEFKKEIDDSDIILFPSSDRSLKTAQGVFKFNQIITVVSYKTISNPQLIDNHDAYVFTSPSNVEAFFKQNKLPSEAKIVAIGHSTHQSLLKKGAKSLQAWAYHSQALWDSI